MLENYKSTEELVSQLLDKIKERITKNNKSPWDLHQEQNHEPKL
jgi:uncharacterized spore protein YtfJ